MAHEVGAEDRLRWLCVSEPGVCVRRREGEEVEKPEGVGIFVMAESGTYVSLTQGLVG